jgi:hypothetical protein
MQKDGTVAHTSHRHENIGIDKTPTESQGLKIMGRGILLWMLGVPLPIILLLAMCSHH